MAQTAPISTQTFALQQAPRLPQVKRTEIPAIKPVERRNPEPQSFADEVEAQDQKRAEAGQGGAAKVVSLADYSATRFQQAVTAPPPKPANGDGNGLSATFFAQQFANRSDSEPPPERNFGPRQQMVGIAAYEAVQSSRPQSRANVEYMNEDTPSPAFIQAVGARLPAVNFLA